MTGKLSDFAGLFVFPLFLFSFFPKNKLKILWITAIGFLWWKSPLSQFFIDAWNDIGLFAIQRVVDYSDYIAFVSLYLALKYSNSEFKTIHISPIFVIIVSCFAFCATSAIEPVPYFFPNPNVQAFIYKIDSLKSYEQEINTYNFQKNSNGFYVPKHDFHSSLLDKKILDDTIILIKELGISYFEETQKLRTKSGKARFLKRTKSRYASETFEFLSKRYEVIPSQPIQIKADTITDLPRTISVTYYPLILNQIDSFQLLTNQFGKLEHLEFINSKLHGKYIQYFDSTNIEVKGFYQNGIEEGTWEFFDSIGRKIKEEEYVNGLLEKRTFFENGEKINDKTVITYQSVVRLHVFFLFIFISILIGVIYLYLGWKRKNPKNENIKYNIIFFLKLLIFSIGISFMMAYCNIYIMSILIESLKIFGWDIPTDLSDFIFMLFASAISSFIYFAISGRFIDILWFWVVFILSMFILLEFRYLLSL